MSFSYLHAHSYRMRLPTSSLPNYDYIFLYIKYTHIYIYIQGDPLGFTNGYISVSTANERSNTKVKDRVRYCVSSLQTTASFRQTHMQRFICLPKQFNSLYAIFLIIILLEMNPFVSYNAALGIYKVIHICITDAIYCNLCVLIHIMIYAIYRYNNPNAIKTRDDVKRVSLYKFLEIIFTKFSE